MTSPRKKRQVNLVTPPSSHPVSILDLSEFDFSECRCQDMSLPDDTPCSMEWHPYEKALHDLRVATQHAKRVEQYRAALKWMIAQGNFHPSSGDGQIIEQIFHDTYSWAAMERATRQRQASDDRP